MIVTAIPLKGRRLPGFAVRRLPSGPPNLPRRRRRAANPEPQSDTYRAYSLLQAVTRRGRAAAETEPRTDIESRLHREGGVRVGRICAGKAPADGAGPQKASLASLPSPRSPCLTYLAKARSLGMMLSGVMAAPLDLPAAVRRVSEGGWLRGAGAALHHRSWQA